jgi:hypothetical protein
VTITLCGVQYAALIAKRLAQWHAKMEIPDVPKVPAWSTLVRKWLELIPKNDLSHVQREEQVHYIDRPDRLMNRVCRSHAWRRA